MKKRKKRITPAALFFLFVIIFLLVYNPFSARLMTIIISSANGVDRDVFYKLVEAESSFNSFAVSRKKAIGLGQVKSSTARYIFPHYVPGMLFFPPTNLHISAIYYKHLLEKYRGNHTLALAAYNWGEGNVDHKLRQEEITIDSDKNYRELFVNVPETYYYVGKVLRD